MYDYLIVGAGFAGSVLAERLAAGSGQQVLLVDRRPHVGGNAYDAYNDAGILIHEYGPHIFHTNSKEVFEYLSRFTSWRTYEHEVLARVDGQLVPIPINLDTVNRLYNMNLKPSEVEAFFGTRCAPPRTWWSARSAANCTRNSSADTRASNGISIPPSWMPR
jgi:UDP-galactopyranose mutase